MTDEQLKAIILNRKSSPNQVEKAMKEVDRRRSKQKHAADCLCVDCTNAETL